MSGPPGAARAWQSSGMERSVLTARTCIFLGRKWKIRGARWNMLKCQTRGKTSQLPLSFWKKIFEGSKESVWPSKWSTQSKNVNYFFAKWYLINLMLQHLYKKSVPSFLFKILLRLPQLTKIFIVHFSVDFFFRIPKMSNCGITTGFVAWLEALKKLEEQLQILHKVFFDRKSSWNFSKRSNPPLGTFYKNSEKKNPNPLQQWWLAKILSFSFEIVPFQGTCWILVVYID